MRVNGNIFVNKPIESVYNFLTQLENLKKLLPSTPIDDYKIEVDDDISGKFELETVLAFYMHPIYEGEEDKVIELEITKLIENKLIMCKLISMGKYDEKSDEWIDYDSLEKIFGDMYVNMCFQDQLGSTSINIEYTAKPKNRVVRFFFNISMYFNMRKSRKYMKEWAAKIEENA